ncbi:Nucleoside-diphosphate-sugar epimerase [Cohaesibacter sp. ES.047]|uniref:NAD-dependent epimerase/dehydratase family protein n=1 Tax=Cohaesibacter sp. ES.047 TaxID=1798205 RepID=UPI000BB99185|nr:NAD-dependent epimerase/dehydratase family protein [Cohaesibacter sp. ES.047]SNY93931.1 Nucleoside-diphosphate-sugar epimerase [Cohaesibacter sp. ES.047]
MRIFVTGGTGQIGTAVVNALHAKNYRVTTLARSDASAELQKAMGATPIRGSLTEPDGWVTEALDHDAIVHAAATFESNMGEVDHELVASLLKAAQDMPVERKIPFIYTGGCWLYPEAPIIPITERHVLDPLPEFAWMLDSIEELATCPSFLLTVIHPAYVVDGKRGTVANFAKSLKEDGSIRIVEDPETHHPFIHADDIADLYVRAVEHGGDGLLLNATAIKSATAGDVAKLVAERLNLPLQTQVVSLEDIQDQLGNWASGYGRSQRMQADRAKDVLDWSPRYDTIEAIVDACLADLS